jgi:hypothetical protein
MPLNKTFQLHYSNLVFESKKFKYICIQPIVNELSHNLKTAAKSVISGIKNKYEINAVIKKHLENTKLTKREFEKFYYVKLSNMITLMHSFSTRHI